MTTIYVIAFIITLAIGLWLSIKYAVYRPLNKAHLSAFDLPIEAVFVNEQASKIHQELEQYLLVSDAVLDKSSKNERLMKRRQTMDDAGIRIKISSVIVPVNIMGKSAEQHITQKLSFAAPIKGEWLIAPKSNNQQRMLYIHGGAFYLGSPQSHRIITGKFSEISHRAVFSLDYRLRPEHPRLASLEDCKNAYLWLLENGPNGQASAESIIVAGDSAGGNLCLALLAWIRDSGITAPEAAICLSPVTDSSLSSPSIIKNLATDAMLQSGISQLLKCTKVTRLVAGWFDNKVKLTDPRISPLFGELSNLPPTFIQVSNSECLEDDARRYANKARLAGSEVTLQVWANMMHVWHTFEPELAEAKAAFSEIEKFMVSLDARNHTH